MAAKTCVECGRPIPKGRLKALPETETCIACSHVVPVCEASWGRGFSAAFAVDDSPTKEPVLQIDADFR